MGQRDGKSKKELVRQALWPKPVYQGATVFHMLYVYNVHIKMLNINPGNKKASPKKSQVIKSAQSRKSGSVHRHCHAKSEGSV